MKTYAGYHMIWSIFFQLFQLALSLSNTARGTGKGEDRSTQSYLREAYGELLLLGRTTSCHARTRTMATSNNGANGVAETIILATTNQVTHGKPNESRLPFFAYSHPKERSRKAG